MKIKHKLPVAFGVVMALLVAAALIGIFALMQVLDTFTGEVRRQYQHERDVRAVQANSRRRCRNGKTHCCAAL